VRGELLAWHLPIVGANRGRPVDQLPIVTRSP
jgi:hypothetical protein